MQHIARGGDYHKKIGPLAGWIAGKRAMRVPDFGSGGIDRHRLVWRASKGGKARAKAYRVAHGEGDSPA